LPFEVLQDAVGEKPAKLDELTLLKVRLWLVLEYFRIFVLGGQNFPVSGREFPVAMALTKTRMNVSCNNCVAYLRRWFIYFMLL